jgi:hypothetical protein
MGFGVWVVGYADHPYPKIFFFPPKGLESGRDFRKAGDFVKVLDPQQVILVFKVQLLYK